MSEEYISKSQDPNINLIDIAEFSYIDEQRDLSKIIERQIGEFIDLDFNLLNDSEISNVIFIDVLLFVNNNYIDIPGIETIITDPNTLNKIGSYIDELFTVELLDYIFPQMLLSLDLKDPTELTVLAYDGFKSVLQQITYNRLISIKELYVISGNNELYNQLLKWTFYYDLFDANLENFIDRTVSILVNAYDERILSKMIDI